MTESVNLLELVIRVREHAARSTTEADRQRIARKISALNLTEQTAARKLLGRMLGLTAGASVPNRDRR